MDGFGRHHNVPEFLRARKVQPKNPVPRLKEPKSRMALQMMQVEDNSNQQMSEMDTPRMFEPNLAMAHPSDGPTPQFLELGFSDRNLVPDPEVLRQQRELLASRERLQTRETTKESHAASRGLLSRESKLSGVYRSQATIKPQSGILLAEGGLRASEILAERSAHEEVSFRDFRAGPLAQKKPVTPVQAVFDIKSSSRAKLETVNENTNDQNPSASHHEIPYEHIEGNYETKPQSSQLNMAKRYPVLFEQNTGPGWENLKYQRRDYREMRTRTAGLQSSPTRRFEFSQLADNWSPPDPQVVLRQRQKPRLASHLPSMKHLAGSTRYSEKESPRFENEVRPMRMQKKYGLQPSASEPALKVRAVGKAGELPNNNDRFKQQKIRTANSGAPMFFGGEPTPNMEKANVLETSAHVPVIGKQLSKLADRWSSDSSLPSLSKNSYSDLIRQNMGELPRLVDRRIAEKIMQENKHLRTVVTRDNLIIDMLAENLFV